MSAPRVHRVIAGLLLVAGAVLAWASPSPAQAVPPTTTDSRATVLGDVTGSRSLASGVVHREFTTTVQAGRVIGDVIEADLANPRVSADVLRPGAIADRASVSVLANRRGAVAAINGDFFDLGGTNAPAGPMIDDSRPVKAAIPPGRRAAPPIPPGATADAVFGVTEGGAPRMDRARLVGSATGLVSRARVPIGALNQHVIPVGGVGVFTAEWGGMSRAGAVCGSNTDPRAGCSPNVAEVVVRNGLVSAVRSRSAAPIAAGDTVLVGRDAGADALRGLRLGEPVRVDYQLVSDGERLQFAVGGTPILRGGQPFPELDGRERAPRSAAGIAGSRMFLVTVDGRQDDSVGLTLTEFARLLAELGIADAVNLDGGGSSTLALRPQGGNGVVVVNDPSAGTLRLVPNGIGIFVR